MYDEVRESRLPELSFGDGQGAMQVAAWFGEPRKIPLFAEPLFVDLRLMYTISPDKSEGDAATWGSFGARGIPSILLAPRPSLHRSGLPPLRVQTLHPLLWKIWFIGKSAKAISGEIRKSEVG